MQAKLIWIHIVIEFIELLVLCSTKGHTFSKQAMKEQTNFEGIFH